MELFFTEIKYIITPIHAMLGAIGVGATIATDVLFLEFLRDFKVSKTERRYAENLSRVFWIALAGLFLTGIALTLSDPARYLASSKFMTKMTAVIIITINGLILNYVLTPGLIRLKYDQEQPLRETLLKRLSFLCGSVSLFSWPLAFFLGSISKIPFSIATGITLYLLSLIAVGLISQTIYTVKVNR